MSRLEWSGLCELIMCLHFLSNPSPLSHAYILVITFSKYLACLENILLVLSISCLSREESLTTDRKLTPPLRPRRIMPVIWGLNLKDIQWWKFKSSYMFGNRDYHLRRTKFVVYQVAMIFCVVSESVGTAALSGELRKSIYRWCDF